MKNKRFEMRVSQETIDKLNLLAAKKETSKADVITEAIQKLSEQENVA